MFFNHFDLTLIWLILVPCCQSTWWLLGLQSTGQLYGGDPQTGQPACHHLPYLAARQKELCLLDNHVLKSVSEGVRAGIDECQHQFRHHMWNCSTYNSSRGHVFGTVAVSKSRETAYIHSISAAGVTYSVTRACSKGQLAECGCDPRASTSSEISQWKWGGCSEDVEFGRSFSEQFVDSDEDRETASGLMNLHNNKVGRMEIRRNLIKLCKCHGLSGSCNLKICWRKMAHFRKTGKALREKFESAARVKVVRRRRHLKLKPRNRRYRRASKHSLVYLRKSPDFCTKNKRLGIAGTSGRQCNASSWGQDSCRVMCCGRGWKTSILNRTEQCHCRFIYCCHVKCRMCHVTTKVHRCN